MPYRQTITAAYDAGAGEEYNRLAVTPSGEAEYKLITELLGEYLHSGSIVIDIGAGPGRYAEDLLERGCKVGLADLSANSLKAFSERTVKSSFRKNILFNRVSCATQLNWIGANIADAILLMGPMYHLVNEDHRKSALTNCKRILKPGGVLFTIFLSPLPSNQYVETITTYTNFQGYEVPQFRCRPETAKRILFENGFKTIRTRNLEDVGWFFQKGHSKCKSPDSKKNTNSTAVNKSDEYPNLMGVSPQYLCVGIVMK